MFLFREEEFRQLNRFLDHPSAKAMAIHGRRRTGKTRLLTEYMERSKRDIRFLYFQCTSCDYHACLSDFIATTRTIFPDDPIICAGFLTPDLRNPNDIGIRRETGRNVPCRKARIFRQTAQKQPDKFVQFVILTNLPGPNIMPVTRVTNT